MITSDHIAALIARERQRGRLADAERQDLIAQAKAARSSQRQARPVGRQLRQALSAAVRVAVLRRHDPARHPSASVPGAALSCSDDL